MQITSQSAPQAAPLPAIREDLKLMPGPRHRDGSPSWRILDPIRNQFFEIGWLEFELLARWAEFSAFTFAMRTHPGSSPGLNWQVYSDAATAAHFFGCVRVFQALAGLRRRLRAALAARGTPPYAPMAAHYPSAPWALPPHQQFMMGGALLVAPVTDANASSARVWLPAGTQWRHFSTNQSFAGQGGEVEVAAPIGQPCALWLV